MTTPTSKVPFRDGGPTTVSAGPLSEAGPVTLLADVSEFQAEIADAAYLAWSRAVVIRALYGDAHDDGAWYGGQRRALLHAGGARFLGIYAYLVAGQSPAAQARAFRSLVGGIQPGEVFIADFEEGAKPLLTQWYDEMLALYGAAIRPYLWTYTGLWFGESAGVLPVEWVAAYQAAEPSTPHRLWQFTDSFPVPGVGTADCSLFRGSIDELAALAYQPAPKPVPHPADWTFTGVRDLKVINVGPSSVRVSWASPSPPEPGAVAYYEVAIQAGGRDLPSYPRRVPHGAPVQEEQFGSLPADTGCEVLIRACAAGTDAHAGPWAKVAFRTPAK